MKEFESTFSSIIKPVVSEEKDKYLSIASLKDIQAFIPNIDININHDLLPVAFNAFVVNRVNKNDDIIDTATALSIYKNFLYKQINAEHDRKNVIGVILNAGFSEFGTDKPLTEEEVKGMITPFNVTLGGVIWRAVNNKAAASIEESNDPTSELYLKISASWELGFTGYEIVILPDGQKNIDAGYIIAEASEVEKYRPILKALKGSGYLEDNRRVYRKPSINVVPLGIGITENPAADVKGIATKSEEDSVASLEGNTSETINKNNISQPSNSNVNIERNQMNIIKTLKDITDENLKTATASVISDIIANELTEKSKVWEEEKNSLNTQLQKAQADHVTLTENYTKVQDTIKTLEATVLTLQSEKAEREKVEKFNARMNEISAAYDLDDEARAAIVDELKAIASDEDFNKWKKKATVLLKGYAKKAAPKAGEEKKDEACSKCGKKHEGECEAAASTNNNNVVDDALDKAKKDKANITNTSNATQGTLIEKYQHAFAKENFVIKY